VKIASRKTIIAAGAAVLSLGFSSSALAGEPAENADQVSEVYGSINSPLQDDTSFGAASLFTQVGTQDKNNDPVIPAAPAEEVRIDFDKDINITTNAKLPECAQASITGGTEAATLACATALLGTGNATARIPGLPTENQQTELTVVAFNGANDDATPVILLHADNAALPTNVVVGDVIPSPNGAEYGKQLEVQDVPDVLSDTGSLVFFNSQIQRKWTNGKTGDRKRTYNYITARCTDDWDFRANWIYETPAPVTQSQDTDTYAHDCTPKP
jgi:hypothetical protein